MRYLEFFPPTEIEHLVKKFWILEYASTSSESMSYSLFADGLPNVVIQYSGTRFLIEGEKEKELSPLCHFSGQTNSAVRMQSKGSFGMLGAYLYPTATRRIFKLEAEEVTNYNIALDTLFGSEASILEEQVFYASSDQERIRIFSNFLKRKACTHSDALIVDQMVNVILKQKGRSSIKELASCSGYSIRQFERRFKKQTGLTPKLFSRIVRFHNALKSYSTFAKPSLVALAYNSGYADQAHFIREFTEFAGLSPKVYFKELDEVAGSFVQL